jgi:hypothetical protein
MTIARMELAPVLSEKTGFSVKNSAEFIEQVFEIIMETLKGRESKSRDSEVSLCVRSTQGKEGTPRPSKRYGFPAGGS